MTHGLEQMGNGNTWGLENKLAHLLKPVTPNPVFVESLKLKLSRTPAVILESGKKNVALIAVGAGLFAGALAYWLYRKFSK